MDTERSVSYKKTCLDYYFEKPLQIAGDVRVVFYEKSIGGRLFYCNNQKTVIEWLCYQTWSNVKVYVPKPINWDCYFSELELLLLMALFQNMVWMLDVFLTINRKWSNCDPIARLCSSYTKVHFIGFLKIYLFAWTKESALQAQPN